MSWIKFEIWLERMFLDSNMPKYFAWDEDSAGDGVVTHETWEKNIKAQKPIRFFLFYTIPHWLSKKVIRPIDDFFYWIKSFLWRKDHLLDLRQPKTGSYYDYRWGYLEPEQQLIYACFNILIKHVDYINSCKYAYGTNDIEKYKRELEEEGNFRYDKNSQLHSLEEMRYIYNYCKTIRPRLFKEHDTLLSLWSANRGSKHEKMYFDQLNAKDDEIKLKEEDALIRLVKIRGSLWT